MQAETEQRRERQGTPAQSSDLGLGLLALTPGGSLRSDGPGGEGCGGAGGGAEVPRGNERALLSPAERGLEEDSRIL